MEQDAGSTEIAAYKEYCKQLISKERKEANKLIVDVVNDLRIAFAIKADELQAVSTDKTLKVRLLKTGYDTIVDFLNGD
jgi:hypothetical protein